MSALSIGVLSTPGFAQDLRFQGPDIEEHLAKGEAVKMQNIGQGITLPRRVTLIYLDKTHQAAWKTVEISRPGYTTMKGAPPELDFEDTYRAECAAYLLDRLLNLNMVPATVARTLKNEKGSLTFWVAPAFPEAERIKKKLRPPDQQSWDQQILKMRYFDQLIYNTDRHAHNLLITPEWDVRLIDHSRSFRKLETLRQPAQLTRFSRSLLEAAAKLDETILKEHLGPFISEFQIRALLRRRDLIAELAKQRVAALGEEKVLYP